MPRKDFDAFEIPREEWLFDEERPVRFQECGKLFGHGFVDLTVKVNASVHHDLTVLNRQRIPGEGMGYQASLDLLYR